MYRSEKAVLPDGRAVICPNRSEALGLWQEIGDGSAYATAVADLRPQECVLDVGAHVGLSSLYAAGRMPHIRILAFEPAAATYECLALNFERHVPIGTAVKTAIGATEDSMTISYRPLMAALSTTSPCQDDEERNLHAFSTAAGADPEVRDAMMLMYYDVHHYEVAVSTISAIIELYGVTHIGVLKVDVERAERDVLAGIAECDWPRIRQLVLDVHDIDGRLAEIVELLKNHGYSVVAEQPMFFSGTSIHQVFARLESGGTDQS